MASWRLKWMMSQWFDRKGFRGHTAVLASPFSFYWGMLATLPVHALREPLLLRLRSGGSVRILQFMNLYIYKEIFVDRCYDVALARTDPLIVDIGANTGLFALRMKQLYPDARITCFEPFPPNFEELEQTIYTNRLVGVATVNKAIADRAGTARLFIHRRNVGGHSLYSQQADSKDFIDVEVVSIHKVVESFDDPIDLLKLDCEGAEYQILKSLTPATANRILRVIVEPTPKLYDIEEVKAHMRSLGYSVAWLNGLYEFVRERR